jgi:hypothetical protein
VTSRAQRVKPLQWDGVNATANGLFYGIFSEHVRGEPRFYWPMVSSDLRGGGWERLYRHEVPVDEPPGYDGTKAQAKRYAALHAAAVEAAQGDA